MQCQMANAANYLHLDNQEVSKYTLDPSKFHHHTNRSIFEYFKLTPSFVGDYFTNASKSRYPVDSLRVLESGCGGGYALGQLLYMLPGANATCINKGGYTFVQSESPTAFVLTNYNRVRVNCRVETSRLVPILPYFHIMDKGITHEPINLPTSSYDYIYSVFSLDRGL